MPKRNRSFVVVGLGQFGSTVASELARFGNHVLGIDADERRVAQMSSTLTASAILDCGDEQALREAGVDRYDVALVAIGQEIQASILGTMNLKMLGVRTIWVKASNRTHHRILVKLGVDRVILPEQEMGRHIAQMLNNPVVQDYVNLGNGFSVVSMSLPERHDNATVASLNAAPCDVRLLGLMRGTHYLPIDTASLTLRREDKLLVLGKRPDLQRFGDKL